MHGCKIFIFSCRTLVGEVKEIDGSAPGETQGKKAQLDLQEYKKTSLGPYIEVFKKFVDKLKTQRDVDGIKGISNGLILTSIS